MADDRHERHVDERVVEHPGACKLGEVTVFRRHQVEPVLRHPLRHARPEALGHCAKPGQAPAHLAGLGMCVALLRKEVAHGCAARLSCVLQPDKTARLVDEALASVLVSLLHASESRVRREAERRERKRLVLLQHVAPARDRCVEA